MEVDLKNKSRIYSHINYIGGTICAFIKILVELFSISVNFSIVNISWYLTFMNYSKVIYLLLFCLIIINYYAFIYKNQHEDNEKENKIRQIQLSLNDVIKTINVLHSRRAEEYPNTCEVQSQCLHYLNNAKINSFLIKKEYIYYEYTMIYIPNILKLFINKCCDLTPEESDNALQKLIDYILYIMKNDKNENGAMLKHLEILNSYQGINNDLY
jgi:Ca2+/Na+ antiporter